MRVLNKAKDGGAKSTVDAFFLCEFKRYFSVAFLRFNTGGGEEFHSHAFNAYTWFLFGNMYEETRGDSSPVQYTRRVIPKLTQRDKIHRVYAFKTSWCFTVRGPWVETWSEFSEDGTETLFGWGRAVLKRFKDGI